MLYKNPIKSTAVAVIVIMLAASGCHVRNKEKQALPVPSPAVSPMPTPALSPSPTLEPSPSPTLKPTPSPTPSPTPKPAAKPPVANKPSAVQVVANPTSISVLVNKSFALPNPYAPKDLIEVNVAFIYPEPSEKRYMREEAASALVKLFKAADAEGLPLAGVSGYRSYQTQTALYNRYVDKDGEAAANKYSAKPGQSEHQTGLAIDVTGANGKCPATDCFGATQEAKWLKSHSAEWGFIIRYPKGKESVTGYQYEPWHLRYVGVDMARDIAKQGITLEEYLGKTLPVNNTE